MKRLLFMLSLMALMTVACEKDSEEYPVRYCWRCETILDGAVLTQVTVCGVEDITDFEQGLQAQATAMLHKSCTTHCIKTH